MIWCITGNGRPRLRDFGECEVKHGVRLHLVNLYAEPLGNAAVPQKFQQTKPKQPTRRSSVGWIAALVLVAILAAGAAYYFTASTEGRRHSREIKRGRALGAASSAWAVASVAGPLLGTLIVTHVSWRWAFLINVPIAIVAGFLVIAGMRESIGHSVGRFDFAGALLAGAGGSCLMWAFVDLGEGQIGPMQAALVAAGIILLAIFVWHEGRTPHPILPLTFFHHAGYASSISSSFLAFFSGFGLSAYLPLATNAAFHDNRAFVGLVVGAFTIGWSTFAFASGRLVHRIGERLPSVIGIIVHILGLLFFMVAFEHGLGWVIAAALIAGAGMGLLSPALTVVVQNSVPVARMGSATTSQQFIRQIGAALGISAFVLAATVGGFRLGLLLMIAVSAGTFACVLALPAHSLHDAHQIDALE